MRIAEGMDARLVVEDERRDGRAAKVLKYLELPTPRVGAL